MQRVLTANHSPSSLLSFRGESHPRSPRGVISILTRIYVRAFMRHSHSDQRVYEYSRPLKTLPVAASTSRYTDHAKCPFLPPLLHVCFSWKSRSCGTSLSVAMVTPNTFGLFLLFGFYKHSCAHFRVDMYFQLSWVIPRNGIVGPSVNSTFFTLRKHQAVFHCNILHSY